MDRSKNFRSGMLIIGTKAKHFDLVQKCSNRKQILSLFFPKNSGTKQSNLIWSGNCLGQNRTFLCNPKTYRLKQNVSIWSASKTICLFQGAFNYATHLFKVRKIGAKLIFFLSNIDYPYQRYAESTIPRS